MKQRVQQKHSLILLVLLLSGCAATRGNFFAHALTAGAPVDQPAAEHPASGAGPGRALHEAQQSRVACQQNPDEPLSQAITSCLHWQQQQVGCALLEAQGYLAGGVQSLLPDALSGTFPVPDSCGSTDVSLVLKQQQLRFDAGGRSVLAVIAKGAGSSAFFFSRGTSKGLISLREQPTSLELCLSPPGEGSVQAQQTAAYSPRLAAGSVSWQLKKSVQLPPAFADGVVQMLQGDTVEAAWTLAATKAGDEASFQGVVTGSISIINTRPTPVTVYGVLTAVRGGPSAVVSCRPSMPFQVPACTTTVCSFTAQYPQPPAAGRYAATTTVQYQEPGRAQIALAEAQTGYEVPKVAAALAPGVAKIPAGQAIVTDTQLPGQILSYSGTGQQSYVTMLTCPSSGSVVNSATLLAATGQEVSASANVQKNCHKLDVHLVEVGQPVVARWHWAVSHTASSSRIGLRSASAVHDDFGRRHDHAGSGNATTGTTALQLFGAAGGAAEEQQLPPTEDVTYRVHVTRSLQKGADGTVAPFMLTGKVLVVNPSPMNAKLAGVTIQVTDPEGAHAAVSVAASCPLLAVASGQSLACRWTATPAFNPIGGSVTAVARYVANRNGGGPSGEFVDFESAAVTVGDSTGADAPDEGSTDSLSTFGRTFAASVSALGGSVKRSLLQWAGGSSSSSSAPSFNPAAFLSHVWGSTGANTILTPLPQSTFAPGAALPAVPTQPNSVYQTLAPPNSFAAPAPLTSLPARLARDAPHPWAPQVEASSEPEYNPGLVPAKPGQERQPAVNPKQSPSSSSSRKQRADSTNSSTGGRSKGSATSQPPAAAVDPHRRVATPPATPAAVAATAASKLVGAEAAAVSAASAAEPAGLLDDCADVSHELAFEPGLLPGRVVSGKPPSGRICGSSVFVYSVRYGPYASCSTGSKAASAVRLMTADTRRVRSSVAEVDIDVRGCKPGLDAVVAAARPAADVAASWEMRMHAEHPRLQLHPGQVKNNSYAVAYERQLTASAPRLFVVVSLKNTGHSTPLIGDASYTINVTCGAQTHVRSNAFACSSNKVAPGSSANCSFVVPLPCAAKGLLQAQLQVSTGEVVRTPVTEFAAPDLDQLVAMEPSRSACIKVSYEGSGQKGKHKPGKLVGGQLPKGTLCQPQSFSFTRQFGPYSKCGQTTARVSAGFQTAAGVFRSQALLTALEVTGCDSSSSSKQGKGAVAAAAPGAAAAADAPVSSRMRLSKASRSAAAAGGSAAGLKQAAPANSRSSAKGTSSKGSKLGGRNSSTSAAAVPSRPDPAEKLAPGGCVYQPWFWKHCMLPDLPGEAACDVIITSLPGGQGPRTPFFPYRKSPKIRRTYRQLLVAPKKTGNRIVDLHFYAAKVFIATQLNQYAGVAMPRLVRAAYLQLGRDYFSVYDDRSAAELLPSKPDVLQQVAAAAKVLADFTGGKLPGLPTCASVKKQASISSQRRRPPSQKQH